MNLVKALLISVTTIVLFACSNQVDSNKETIIKSDDSIVMKQANWFLGSWQNKTSDGDFTEIWKQKNDSVYIGVSYVIVKTDTVFYESISLEQKNKKWNYIVSVKNQNNEQPVSFEMTSMTPNQLVFENPSHDFPSKITYTKITQDSMVAKISGILKGKDQTEYFPMKRFN
jgi:hypothetical protein